MRRSLRATRCKDGWNVSITETHLGCYDKDDVKRLAGYCGIPEKDIVFVDFPSPDIDE